MPDPEIRVERAEEKADAERRAVGFINLTDAHRPPIHEAVGPHEFVPSEFVEGAGRCDRCGGGPLHAIHEKKVDPLERIDATLGRIASELSARATGDVLLWLLLVLAFGGLGVLAGYHLK